MRLGLDLRTNFRRLGDRHRNARNWPEAAGAYARHLERHPEDKAIHVQFGHALKEQGKIRAAAEAYGAAVALDPDDSDALEHLADVLRQLRRDEEALEIYERLIELKPSRDALEGARRLRRKAGHPGRSTPGAATVFMAIQDLIGYLKAHPTMSGIQRVQAGIALYAMNREEADIRFILGNSSEDDSPLAAGDYLLLDNASLKRVIEYASGVNVDHEALRALLEECECGAEIIRPLPGNTIILLGAFWGLGNSVQQFVESRKNGVRIGAYVYDIIPITHPEFCDDDLAADFTLAFCELCSVADFILTISDATRSEVDQFLRDHGGRLIPTKTVRLAHHLGADKGGRDRWPAALERIKGRRYVAYVSTMEARKNHIYVVNAWRELIARRVAVPDLVFVGRYGWKISALEEVLRSTGNLGGRVHVVHGLSDGELNAIYENCDFTVFTSFTEGWGLPIGESLYHGRPCVASNTTSMPEVGGELVDYVDPHNLRDGIERFRRMITDRSYRERRAAEIKSSFRPRNWNDVGQDFLEEVNQFRTSMIKLWTLALGDGDLLRFDNQAWTNIDLQRYFDLPKRLLVDSAVFYTAEPHGSWMRGTVGRIFLPTSVEAESDVVVYLRAAVAPWCADAYLVIQTENDASEPASCHETRIRVPLRDLALDGTMRFTAQVHADRSIRLRFTIEGRFEMPAGDHRNFVFGLQSLGYARRDNPGARQDVLEQLLLPNGVF